QIQWLEDWYSITYADCISFVESRILVDRFHGHSHTNALVFVYPDTNWNIWKFSRVPSEFWEDKDNRIHYFEWVADQLDVKEMENWYLIDSSKVRNLLFQFDINFNVRFGIWDILV